MSLNNKIRDLCGSISVFLISISEMATAGPINKNPYLGVTQKTTFNIIGNAAADSKPKTLSQNRVSYQQILAQARPPKGEMNRINAVSNLKDITPTDWAYEALRNLNKRYGCLAGYPDWMFRGNQTLNRNEFVAALKACFSKLEHSIQTNITILREDIEKLKRLARQFESELTLIGNRINNLEHRVAFIENNQFSTTVWLNGTSILGLSAASGGDPPGAGGSNPILNHVSYLGLSASFTGEDRLRIGLNAGNFSDNAFAASQALNTRMALLSYQSNTDSKLEVNSLEYRFMMGDRIGVVLKPQGFSLATVLDPLSPHQSAAVGSVSRFAAYSSIFRMGSVDAGLGVDILLNEQVQLQLAYGARDAGDSRQGLFSSDHRAFGLQFLFFNNSESNLKTGITYINAVSEDGRLDTFTGSFNADTSGFFNESSTINAVNGSLEWEFMPNLTFGTWGGLAVTDSLESDAISFSTTFLFSLGLKDPFARNGDLLGFMVGQPLRLRGGVAILGADQGSSLHYEVFYRYRVTDNMYIAPGFFFVTDPGHIRRNNDIFVGTVRTILLF
ncbi:MAG TPA: S-layer protein [Cyanothece sp. UBA12306]|nr:S-layer protein [Cyanothece sp. UBA12306]